jgi:hypothetical protein
MNKTVIMVFLLVLCPVWAVLGQQSNSVKISIQGGETGQGAKEKDPQTSQPQKGEKKPLTNADVVSMVKAGLAESTIALAIQKSATDFDTSPQELISLKNQGVPQKVLDAMLTAGTEKNTATAVAGEGPATSVENGKWEAEENVSPLDGSRAVYLNLKAEQSVPGMAGLGGFPLMVIRCKSRATDVFINTGSLPFDPDSGGKYSVRLRLDDGQPFTQYWNESAGYDSLFSPNPIELAKELAAAKKLAFEFKPLGSVPVATWFDLTGLDGLIGKVADACGWSGAPPAVPASVAELGLSSIRRVYVEDPHQFGYTAPGHIKKGLSKSTCLQLVDGPAEADIVLTPVQEGVGGWTWIFTNPKTHGRVGQWEMTFFPNSKKVEQALGCRAGTQAGEEEPPTSPTQETATGTVNVTSNPGGADVYVDGQFVGGCPAVLKLKPGKHIVSAKLSGHKDWSREISVEPGSEVRLIVRLEQQG